VPYGGDGGGRKNTSSSTSTSPVAAGGGAGSVAEVFEGMGKVIDEALVEKTKAVFKFNISGE